MSAETSYSPEFIKNIAIACHYAMKSKTDQREKPFMKSWQETSEEDKLLTKEAVVNILNKKPIHFNEEDSSFLTSIVELTIGKLVIEKKGKPQTNEEGLFTFGSAINALKQGFKVARNGWNGKGMFLYYVPENAYPAITKIAKEAFPDSDVPYCAYIAMKTVQNNVVPWLASQSDVLAEDWVIIN